MGGVARIIKSVISQPKAPIKVVEPTAPQTAVSEAPTDMMAQKKTAMGSGYGSQTVLAGAEEWEANVSKTILGGGKKKTIKA